MLELPLQVNEDGMIGQRQRPVIILRLNIKVTHFQCEISNFLEISRFVFGSNIFSEASFGPLKVI